MDAQSQHAVTLLDALTSSRARFYDFAWQMHNRYIPSARIKTANARLDLMYRRVHNSKQVIKNHGIADIYAHAVLSDQRMLEWSVELRWNELQWEIESCVMIDSDSKYGGMDFVKEWPVRIAQALDDCIAHIEALTTDVINSGDALDILKLHESAQSKT